MEEKVSTFGVAFEKTLKTEGMYLGIFDALSPANVKGAWEAAWKLATVNAATNRRLFIYEFNEVWSRYGTSAELLAWVLSFDGVYRVQITLSQPSKNMPHREQINFLGFQGRELFLHCSSGEVTVDNLYALGQPSVATLTVPPGVYQAQLYVDWHQLEQHQFLEDKNEYPTSEGPDFTVYLARGT